jgi:hypothetical protein
MRIEGIRPNPTPRAFTVAFSLMGNGPAWLEVVDVVGRRMLRQDVGSLGPGRHTFGSGDAALSPGVYIVRLCEAGRVVSRPVVVVR